MQGKSVAPSRDPRGRASGRRDSSCRDKSRERVRSPGATSAVAGAEFLLAGDRVGGAETHTAARTSSGEDRKMRRKTCRSMLSTLADVHGAVAPSQPLDARGIIYNSSAPCPGFLPSWLHP